MGEGGKGGKVGRKKGVKVPGHRWGRRGSVNNVSTRGNTPPPRQLMEFSKWGWYVCFIIVALALLDRD